MTDAAQSERPEPQAESSFGASLKQARTGRSLSLAEVSRQTKIQPWVLEAMEADRLQEMLSPIYARGFLATYAKFLRLDAQPLLDRLPKPTEIHEDPAEAGAQQSALPDAVEIPWPLLRRLAAGVAVVGVVAALVAVRPWQRLPQLAMPHMRLPWLASLTPVGKSVEVLPLPSLSLEAAAPLDLAISAERATWVQVRADGKLVAQQRLQRGAHERWVAKKRLEVVVSKPSQVDLVLNGQSISPFAIAHQGRLAITHRGVTRLPDDAQ